MIDEKIISKAVQDGMLKKTSGENILKILNQSGIEQWMLESVQELVEREEWTELNDRFFKTLAFGTAGLRGRTIGKVVTEAERGKGGPNGRPEYAAVGTNALNNLNVSRATQGLMSYLIKQFSSEPPRVVIAHDPRHFSREFAEVTAEVVSLMGGIAYLFEDERSTPELSFAVRHLKAHAGVVITASHNPPHDNGYKVYFQDGGQIVEPHASAIIKEVNAAKPIIPAAEKAGEIISIGSEIDLAYIESLKNLVIETEKLELEARKLKIVYTPLHGTGIKIIPQILDHFGFQVTLPKEQADLDGRFPTVKSPNPENADALAMGVALAKKESADLVFGTDPDADRMGIAVKNSDNEYEMLTGNQIGSIMAAYRLERFFEKGILNSKNANRAAIIKTFVTTDLQKALSQKYGVKCIETLTGFKYIGEKLKDYEVQAGGRAGLSADRWREKRLQNSTYFVFGGEESYGYLATDDVRDKDANDAVLVCSEAACFAANQGMNLLEYLEKLYLEHGFYWEKTSTITFEGAEGAEKIKKLLQTYKDNPPETWNGKMTIKGRNFAHEKFSDPDGKLIPSELMFMFELDDGFKIAIRASGTEPKIKFYFFGHADVDEEANLPDIKTQLKKSLEDLWNFVQADVKTRIGD